MYVTTWTVLNSEKHQSVNDLTTSSDVLFRTKFQDNFLIFNSAVNEDNIINQMLEILKFDNGNCSIDCHFFSTTLEQAQNFQKKLEPIIQLYQDSGWTTSVQLHENIDLNYFQTEVSEAPFVTDSNWLEIIVSPVEPYKMWFGGITE